MRFANKLFFLITSVLTIAFAVFGIWMLSGYFTRVLNREIEQVNSESNLLRYMFEMSYRSTLEYGEKYALDKAVSSVKKNASGTNNQVFIYGTDDVFVLGEQNLLEHNLEEVVKELGGQLKEQDTYVYALRKRDHNYLINVSQVNLAENTYYFGNCRILDEVFADREALVRQYWIAFALLLFIGGLCIYGLAKVVTKPLRNLSSVASLIATGDYEKRSEYKGNDEIGELANSFNSMSDSLVAQMQEKELEAKRKNDFTAAFAHELKTPLTSIIGYADMLNTIELTEEEQREAYYYIYSQGKRLESLSYKLLELVNMEQENLHFRKITSSELEGNIRTTMRPVWEKKKIRGKVSLEKGELFGDYELLLSLFYNLLDNAAKAVEEGGFVLMKGVVTPDGYEIRVVDNGRGIPKEEIGRITEAFYMVDKSRSRKEGGAGIGMALCQKIIQLHHAKLSIDSKLGQGTVMKVFFPKEAFLERTKQ